LLQFYGVVTSTLNREVVGPLKCWDIFYIFVAVHHPKDSARNMERHGNPKHYIHHITFWNLYFARFQWIISWIL